MCKPNRFLAVEIHEVELPDGRRIADWPWIIVPEYANVLAQTEAGGFLCFRQTKYAVGDVSWAPVGGFIEPGEDRLAAAKRELLEETGYVAPEWHDLGTYIVDANRGAGKAHLFLALNARFEKPPVVDDLEEQELQELTRRDMEDALAGGQFKVLAWAALVSMGLSRIRTG